jgi:hypothetical protein
MTTAYCTLDELRRRMSGDQPVLSGASDQTLIDIIADASSLIDEEVRNVRGQQPGWSFLPPSLYGRSLVMVSGVPVSGTFTLTFGASTTVALAFTASAADVQAALDTILGAGQSVVTGAPGGPWLVTYAGTLSGPQPVLEPADTFAPVGAHVVVQELITGSAASVTRRYTGADGGSTLLLIDDAVSVSLVQLLDTQGNVIQTLTAGTDWLPYPLNGRPIIGLQRIVGCWPTTRGGVQATIVPGYALTLPGDVHTASLQESIRVWRGAQAGEDDRLGTTPFGSVIVSKALLQSTQRMIARYRLGAGLLRRAG